MLYRLHIILLIEFSATLTLPLLAKNHSRINSHLLVPRHYVITRRFSTLVLHVIMRVFSVNASSRASFD